MFYVKNNHRIYDMLLGFFYTKFPHISMASNYLALTSIKNPPILEIYCRSYVACAY